MAALEADIVNAISKIDENIPHDSLRSRASEKYFKDDKIIAQACCSLIALSKALCKGFMA